MLARKGTTARMRTSGGHRALDSDIGQPTSDPLCLAGAMATSLDELPLRIRHVKIVGNNRTRPYVVEDQLQVGWCVYCGTSAGPAASGKRPEEPHTRYQSWSLCVASIGLCDGLLLACGCPSSLTGSVNFESSPQAYLGRRGLMRGAMDGRTPAHRHTHHTHHIPMPG